MNNAIKTGVLSFGMSGSLFHCPFLEQHPHFDLIAIVERTNKKAHTTYTNIKSYDTIDELLSDLDIELVIVNTPSVTHFDFALKALENNKHVLVEKPFTVFSQEAKTLFKVAKERSLHLMPFQNRRYDSDFLSVKEVVESGKLGDLIEVHFRYDRYKYKLGENLSKEAPVSGNGLIYNLGSHLVDAALALFGIPLSYRKVQHGHRPGTQIEDYAQVHLEYPNGLQVFITVSLLVANEQPAFILHGTKGSYIKARADVQERQLQLGMKPNNSNFGVEEDDKLGLLTTVDNSIVLNEKVRSKQSSYSNIFEAIYQTIRKNTPYPITEEQIVKQIEIIEN